MLDPKSKIHTITEEFWSAHRPGITEENFMDKCRELHRLLDARMPGTATEMRGRHGRATNALATLFQAQTLPAPKVPTPVAPVVPIVKHVPVAAAVRVIRSEPEVKITIAQHLLSTKPIQVTGLFFRPAIKDRGFYDVALVYTLPADAPTNTRGRHISPTGAILEGESPQQAMVRVFAEFASCQTREADWRVFCVRHTHHTKMYFVNFQGAGHTVVSPTDGVVGWLPLAKARSPYSGPQLSDDLYWLIPLALHQENPSYHIYPKH